MTAAGDQIWHQDSTGIRGNAEASDSFGGALTSADFDGDAVDDLAIGVAEEGLNSAGGAAEPSAGTVNVLYGTAASGLDDVGDQRWDQDSTNVNNSVEDFDRFGDAVSSGDMNGDGNDDLAIGIRGEESVAAGPGASSRSTTGRSA